jgi:hypothetical protein
VIPKDYNSEARPQDSDPATSNDGEELKSILLDTSLPPFIPATPDQHAGNSPLRFSREQLPIDPEILCVCTPEEHPDHTEFVPSNVVPPAPPKDGPVPHAVDPAPVNPDVDPAKRSSTRSKKQPDRFAGNMQTTWKAGKAFKACAAVAATLGVLLLPTVNNNNRDLFYVIALLPHQLPGKVDPRRWHRKQSLNAAARSEKI